MGKLLTRRRFLGTLAGGALLGGGAFGYARWYEPRWLETTLTKIPLSGDPRAGPPLRVVHLSDLHADTRWVSLEFLTQAIAQAVALKPDAFCLTGDFITTRYPHMAEYAEVLKPLARTAPTFACLGNHDGGSWSASDGGFTSVQSVGTLLRAAGITLLLNRAEEITLRGARWQFVGVGDYWAHNCQPEDIFKRLGPAGDAPRILLNHNPDAKERLQPYAWDVMLCGHTHGGQIGFAPLARRLAPVADKRYIAGLYTWDKRSLFITRGVGNLHGGRIFCRPEISVLEIG